jgi:hypothetical protein
LFVDPAATQATFVETVDEHAEPFSDANTSRAGPESEYDTAKTRASGSSGELDDSVAARGPVLNVDALEKATEDTDIEARAEASSAVPEGEEKIEVRTTTH